MKGVILAAGYGRRMAALTTRLPKPMLPIANVPIVEWILHHFKQAGVTDVLLITGYQAEGIESYCGDGAQWGMSIAHQRQTEVSGTGSATRLAESFVGDVPFMLTYGDILLDGPEYCAVVSLFRDAPCAAVSALNRMPEVAPGSAVYVENGRITRSEKRQGSGVRIQGSDVRISNLRTALQRFWREARHCA